MSLSGQFQACFFFFFFYEKMSSTQKHKLSKNQLTKNNKGNGLLRTETSKRGKIVCFAFWCFFYTQIFFVEKQKKSLEIVLIASFTIQLVFTNFNIFQKMHNIIYTLFLNKPKNVVNKWALKKWRALNRFHPQLLSLLRTSNLSTYLIYRFCGKSRCNHLFLWKGLTRV